VVGDRRSIRWFDPDRPVDRAAVQRILEVVRLSGSPANLQPWRAVVVDAAALEEGERERLLEVNNRQGPHVLAPLWIYWYADPEAATPDAFLRALHELLPTGALSVAFGWSEETTRAAIEDGRQTPAGMPGLHQTVHRLAPEISAILAAQETTAACALATLAAVAEGLGTCLHSIARPDAQAEVRGILDVPERFVPVWLQLVGHSVESPEAGGQRPRARFEELFADGRWGRPFPRDAEVVAGLKEVGLLQAEAPLPGREAELEALGRRFAARLRSSD
jgi:nitroreductase